MKTKPETALSKSIQDALKNVCGAWTIRVQTGTVRGHGRTFINLAENGTPDLYVMGLGWLEVKRPGQRLNPAQVNWHARAKEYGERVAVVTSVREAVELVRAWQSERSHERAMGWT